MKIAVVGSGISGLGASLALSDVHDVRLFERDSRIGGHANTVNASFKDGDQPVDTGFIVYNHRNYPNLTSLFEYLDVPTKWSDMSFGFSLNQGRLEYACDNLSTIFAQRWRAADPRFLRTFAEILRFTRVAPRDLASGRLNGMSLGDWLGQRGFGRWFRERFILPMGGAIWSTSLSEMTEFPAASFVRFFVNHDLMTGLDSAQRWRTVDGGSREYVSRLLARLGPRVSVGRAVVAIEQQARPLVRFDDGTSEHFDQVVIATHGPTALSLIAEPNDLQASVLGKFRTSPNRAVLHSDTSLMPRRRRVWSSWNFLSNGIEADTERPAQVTYWMNRLQSIPEDRPLFVSLNPVTEPDAGKIHADFSYDHPLFDADSFEGQAQMDSIQGLNGLWFAGAWLGYGFHEDGLRSGVRVAQALGARPAWVRDTGEDLQSYALYAAE